MYDKRGGTGRKKKSKAGKTNYEKQKFQREMFLTDQATDPLEDSFIPSMKSQNGIFWMVGAGSLNLVEMLWPG